MKTESFYIKQDVFDKLICFYVSNLGFGLNEINSRFSHGSSIQASVIFSESDSIFACNHHRYSVKRERIVAYSS